MTIVKLRVVQNQGSRQIPMIRVVVQEFPPGWVVLALSGNPSLNQWYSKGSVFFPPFFPSETRLLREIGLDGADLVRRLAKLPGVTEIKVEPNRISVEKSPDIKEWKTGGLGTSILAAVTEECFGVDLQQCFGDSPKVNILGGEYLTLIPKPPQNLSVEPPTNEPPVVESTTNGAE
ncbi:MAG: hypothetical protein AAB467_03835 [Patescibacteria group bacterium]